MKVVVMIRIKMSEGSDIRKHSDKECSDIFCNIESTKDKMIEA